MRCETAMRDGKTGRKARDKGETMIFRTMGRLVLGCCVLLWSACAMAGASGENVLGESRQLLLVTSASWEAPSGELRLFEREAAGQPWQQAGPAIPVSLGRTGLAWGLGLHPKGQDGPVKREGDGKAPAGAFRLSTAFGGAGEKMPAKFPHFTTATEWECVDDERSVSYNRLVDTRATGARDWQSSEVMLRPDGLYALGAVVEHNTGTPTPGAGSCIFLHIWRGPDKPTAGCTAMDKSALEALLGRLNAARSPVLVQLPGQEYQRLKSAWALP